MPIEDIIVKVVLKDNLTAPLKRVKHSLQSQLKPMKAARKTLEDLGEEMIQASNTFNMAALSGLFFGMQIQRTFTRIATFGTTSFNAFISSVEGATSNITMLGGWVEFLKFIVGDAVNSALGPFMDTIFNIIMAVANWISENQTLAGWLIILGIAFGALLFVFSMITLAIPGLLFFFGTLATVAIPLLATAFGWLISLLMVNWGKVWSWIKDISWRGLLWLKSVVWDPIPKIFDEKVVQPLKRKWQWFIDNVWKPIKDIVKTYVIDPVIEKWNAFIQKIKDGWQWLKDVWADIKQKMADSIVGKAFSAVINIGKSVKDFFIPKSQFGGFVPMTGPRLMHAGEQVIPAGATNNFGGLTINIHTSGGVDARSIADQLMTEIRRYTNTAGY